MPHFGFEDGERGHQQRNGIYLEPPEGTWILDKQDHVRRGLQNCEIINVCFSSQVCGTLLQPSQETNNINKYLWNEQIYIFFKFDIL